MFEYRARLVRLVDADTIDLEVDLGFGVARTDRFRLFGLDAPEMRTPEGKAARAWAVKELAANGGYLESGVMPWPLVVNTYKDGQDKYGRYLARVRTAATGWDLNAALVAAGHAVTKTY